ncbi:Putative ribonuclease H protein At1g65750 [Linum grandiflorum]
MLTRLDKKLSGWKVKTLSLAGLVTLAQTVLSAIPAYIMQTTVLPTEIFEAIDRRIRNFVWGSSEAGRKIHLISWQQVCTPKDRGVLGLRLARELNSAYMTKLAFIFMQHPELLWVRVLQSKYFRESAGFALRRKYSQSTIWRGIRRPWPWMICGSRSTIRNGEGTLFWTTRWVDAGFELIDHALDVDAIDPNATMTDFVLPNGGWNFQKLQAALPDEAIAHIAGMSPPEADSGDDGWTWGLEQSGRFSIKSAYNLITNGEKVTRPDWNPIWKWMGPNRVRHFLWLVGHERLLTNAERFRRHLTPLADCHRCPSTAETISHTLRDCRFAAEVWRLLGFPISDASGWHLPFCEWLCGNLSRDKKLLFGITLWSL